jgi:hypothetical protein
MTKEQDKAYAVATIAIDRNGNWHCTYIGHHVILGQSKFGNASISDRNIRAITKKLGAALEKGRYIYATKIKETLASSDKDSKEEVNAEPNTTETEPSST